MKGPARTNLMDIVPFVGYSFDGVERTARLACCDGIKSMRDNNEPTDDHQFRIR
jgi:hypothetical protein